MKKNICFYVIALCMCLCLVYIFVLFFSTREVKYDLTDCIRYFDRDGRYRLMLVGDTYFFVDIEKEYAQKSNVIEYYYDDNLFYGLSSVNNQKLYFILNIVTGEHKESNSIDLLSENEKKVFYNDMIDLNTLNQYERFFRKFIPIKLRKK